MTRQICYCALRPHLKHGTSLRDFWSFPWEKEKHHGNGLTMEQERQEFERIKKEYGIQ